MMVDPHYNLEFVMGLSSKYRIYMYKFAAHMRDRLHLNATSDPLM
jgi:hypothetical protein